MTHSRPPALEGIRIPSRNVQARRLVVSLYEALPHLTPADVLAVTRYAEMTQKARRLGEIHHSMGDVGGYLRADFEPRRILAELRAFSDTLSRLEAQLGITAAARAGLGVDVGRIRQLDIAQAMAQRGDDD